MLSRWMKRMALDETDGVSWNRVINGPKTSITQPPVYTIITKPFFTEHKYMEHPEKRLEQRSMSYLSNKLAHSKPRDELVDLHCSKENILQPSKTTLFIYFLRR